MKSKYGKYGRGYHVETSIGYPIILYIRQLHTYKIVRKMARHQNLLLCLFMLMT